MHKVPKWLEGADKPKTHRMSRKQEKKTASLLGTRLTVGSGNKSAKGDSQDQAYGKRGRMVENKITQKKQLTVKRSWLEKLAWEAHQASKEPVLVFGFEEMDFGDSDWGSVPLSRLNELFEKEKELDELRATL